jgi:porphobilinogen deaminase
VGAYAVTSDDKYKITLYANVFSADGTNSIKIRKIGDSKEPSKLGIEVANLLFKEGATKLAEGWRDAVKEWNERL